MYQPFRNHFCSFSPTDGAIDFYLRVNTLTNLEGTYLDYGAGRAKWFEDDYGTLHRSLRHMQGKFREVIAADIDPVVMENRSADRCMLIENNQIDLEDGSVDVIVADYVIEHVEDPSTFVAEIGRILKPGGWFCARTPHKMHYVALADRIIPEKLAGPILHRAQPMRKEQDVFPKAYRLNTMGDITRAFRSWNNRSYTRRTTPRYYFGSRPVYEVMDFAHRLLPKEISGNIMVFTQKPLGL